MHAAAAVDAEADFGVALSAALLIDVAARR